MKEKIYWFSQTGHILCGYLNFRDAVHIIILTIRLKKGVTEAKEIPVKVELEYNAVEREEANKSAIKEDKYSISGYFADNNGNILPNVNLAVYSENAQFIKTDDHGYFYVGNLERGNHEIYYINES